MARHPTALVGVALALAVFGCGRIANTGNGGNSCTVVGCGSSVTVAVEQPGERPLEVCVGAVCSPPGDVLRIKDVPLSDPVEVVVRVAGGGAEVARATARPATSSPNGPGCLPECKAVRLRLTVDDQLLPA